MSDKEEKAVTIVPPVGYEIDREKSTLERIVFKPVVKTLPKTWEELESVSGCFISSTSKVSMHCCKQRATLINKSTVPTKELAEAMLALSQLLQLRDVYNDGKEISLTDGKLKFSIGNNGGKPYPMPCAEINVVLTFHSRKRRDEFLENFKDLIETALPLL